MRRTGWRTALAALVALAGAALPPAALATEPAPAPVQRLRATVVSLAGYDLALATGTRTVLVTLGPDYGVTALVAAAPEAVAAGRFAGAVAVRDARGTLRAREIHLIPEKWRGGPEGERPYDLGPGSVVVTGTVEQGLAGGTGGVVTLTHPGGVSAVVVRAGTPVVTLAPGRRAMLVPGAQVVVEAGRDAAGRLRADHLMVGVDGLVPGI